MFHVCVQYQWLKAKKTPKIGILRNAQAKRIWRTTINLWI